MNVQHLVELQVQQQVLDNLQWALACLEAHLQVHIVRLLLRIIIVIIINNDKFNVQ